MKKVIPVFIVFSLLWNGSIYADDLVSVLQRMRVALMHLTTMLSEVQPLAPVATPTPEPIPVAEAPLTITTTPLTPVLSLPLQQQIMPSSQVIQQLGTGRKDTRAVIKIFTQEATGHSSENNKIPSKGPGIFRIMSYNVHAWADPSGNDNFEGIWRVIDEVNPDVLVLQEATASNEPGKGFLATYEAQTLSAKGYIYHAVCNTIRGRFFGNIVASRSVPVKIGRSSFASQERPGKEDRCFSYLLLSLPNGKNFHIFGTHLEVGKDSSIDHDALRMRQIEQISKYIQSEIPGENVIIVGDFNATRNSSAIQYLMSNTYKDSFSVLGWQHPQFTSMYGTEIDFIFVNPGWNLPLAGSYVYYSAASDHLPVIMDIKVD